MAQVAVVHTIIDVPIDPSHRKVVAMRLPVPLCHSLLVCVLLAAGSTQGQTTTQPDSTGLTVMTFNIRYGTANDGENAWPKRAELVYKMIETHSPDIVGMQEALRFQIDQIKEALPQYAETGVGRNDGLSKGEYSVILFRSDRLSLAEHGTFWFSDTPERPGSTNWGNSIPRICTWARFIDRKTSRSFYVFNIHLDHQSQPSRVRSVELLVRRIAERGHKNDPVIITGDFNAAEDNPAVLFLKGDSPHSGDQPDGLPPRLAFVDSYRIVHPDAVDVGTFNGFKGRRSGGKIDYVLIDPSLDVLDAAILRDNADGRSP